MGKPPKKPHELVAPERIEHLMNLVFGLAAGATDRDMARVEVRNDDHFAELEQLLNAFAQEFLDARDTAESLARERQQLIEDQENLIHQLSTPILDVWKGVLVAPLIGELDDARMDRFTEALLSRISERGSTGVILDITGVTDLGPQTAATLARIARAIALLGCRAIVSGISPAIARILVEHGVELGVPTAPTLDAGLRMFLRRRGLASVS